MTIKEQEIIIQQQQQKIKQLQEENNKMRDDIKELLTFYFAIEGRIKKINNSLK